MLRYLAAAGMAAAVVPAIWALQVGDPQAAMASTDAGGVQLRDVTVRGDVIAALAPAGAWVAALPVGAESSGLRIVQTVAFTDPNGGAWTVHVVEAGPFVGTLARASPGVYFDPAAGAYNVVLFKPVPGEFVTHVLPGAPARPTLIVG